MQPGKFIVFEGISGTGKETQATLLQQNLQSRGVTAQILYHPSQELKKILSVWRKERNIDYITEVYLLLADRYDRVSQLVRPALTKGEWVIGIRSFVSALVYQGQNNSERKWISREFSRFEPKPDCLFYFDLSPAIAMKRVMARYKHTGEQLGKFETERLLIDKRRAYRAVLRGVPHITLDASLSIERLHELILSHL